MAIFIPRKVNGKHMDISISSLVAFCNLSIIVTLEHWEVQKKKHIMGLLSITHEQQVQELRLKLRSPSVTSVTGLP